jgi:peptidoglycan hydrolase CwlO-like protein
MNKKLLFLAGAFLSLSIFNGCITASKTTNDEGLQGKHDQLERDYGNLQSRENDLVNNIQQLKKMIEDKDAQIATVTQQRDDLRKTNLTIRKQI